MLTMGMMFDAVNSDFSHKYDLPDWMRDEHLENCGGFVNEYYSNLFTCIRSFGQRRKRNRR